jgi:hypothetical protein
MSVPATRAKITVLILPPPVVSRRTDSQGLERRKRVNDFVRRHNGTRVIGNIDLRGGMHLFIRGTDNRILRPL